MIKLYSRPFILIVTLILIIAISIKIHYEFSFEKVENWNYKQLQKINPQINSFTFIVFGDNKNSTKVFNELISKVNNENALFCIDNGDLVLWGREENYELFIKQIKKLNKPLLTVLGNHDIVMDGRSLYYEMFGPFYYSFHVGPAYFIVLDNANQESIDPWQMIWLFDDYNVTMIFSSHIHAYYNWNLGKNSLYNNGRSRSGTHRSRSST